MHRVLSMVLVLLIGLVGWRVYYTWSAPRLMPEPDGRGKGSADLDLPSTARTPPPPRLAMSITERDLFDESRRAPEAAAPVASAPVPPPNVELIGVLIVGPEPEALIKDAAQGGGLRHVFTGDDVGGYTVSTISATEVVLLSPQGEEVPLPLTLHRGPAPPSAGKANAAAARRGNNPAQSANAAANKDRGRGGASAGVRERLRELRRQRREANKARQ